MEIKLAICLWTDRSKWPKQSDFGPKKTHHKRVNSAFHCTTWLNINVNDSNKQQRINGKRNRKCFNTLQTGGTIFVIPSDLTK